MLQRMGKENKQGDAKLLQQRGNKYEKGKSNARKPLRDVQREQLPTKASDEEFIVDPKSYEDIIECRGDSRRAANRPERATVGVVDRRVSAHLASRIPRASLHVAHSSLYAKAPIYNSKAARTSKNVSEKDDYVDGSFLERAKGKVPVQKTPTRTSPQQLPQQDFEMDFKADPIALNSILNEEGIPVDFTSNDKRSSCFGPVKRQTVKGRVAPFVKSFKKLAQVNAGVQADGASQIGGIRRNSLYQRESFTTKVDLKTQLFAIMNRAKPSHTGDVKPFVPANAPATSNTIAKVASMGFTATCVGFQDDSPAPSHSIKPLQFGAEASQSRPIPSLPLSGARDCTPAKTASVMSQLNVDASVKSILKKTRGDQRSQHPSSIPNPQQTYTQASSKKFEASSCAFPTKQKQEGALPNKGYLATPVRLSAQARRNLQMGLPLPTENRYEMPFAIKALQLAPSPLGCAPLDDTDVSHAANAFDLSRTSKSVRWAECLTVETEVTPEVDPYQEVNPSSPGSPSRVESCSHQVRGRPLSSPTLVSSLSPELTSSSSARGEASMAWLRHIGLTEKSPSSHLIKYVMPAEQPLEEATLRESPARQVGLSLPSDGAALWSSHKLSAGDAPWFQSDQVAICASSTADDNHAPVADYNLPADSLAKTFKKTKRKKFRSSILERIYGSPDSEEQGCESRKAVVPCENVISKICHPSTQENDLGVQNNAVSFVRMSAPLVDASRTLDMRRATLRKGDMSFVGDEATVTGSFGGPLQSTLIGDAFHNGDFRSYRHRISPGKEESCAAPNPASLPGELELVGTPCNDGPAVAPVAPSSRKTLARTPYKQEMLATLMKYLGKSCPDTSTTDYPLDCTIINERVSCTSIPSVIVSAGTLMTGVSSDSSLTVASSIVPSAVSSLTAVACCNRNEPDTSGSSGLTNLNVDLMASSERYDQAVEETPMVSTPVILASTGTCCGPNGPSDCTGSCGLAKLNLGSLVSGSRYDEPVDFELTDAILSDSVKIVPEQLLSEEQAPTEINDIDLPTALAGLVCLEKVRPAAPAISSSGWKASCYATDTSRSTTSTGVTADSAPFVYLENPGELTRVTYSCMKSRTILGDKFLSDPSVSSGESRTADVLQVPAPPAGLPFFHQQVISDGVRARVATSSVSVVEKQSSFFGALSGPSAGSLNLSSSSGLFMSRNCSSFAATSLKHALPSTVSSILKPSRLLMNTSDQTSIAAGQRASQIGDDGSVFLLTQAGPRAVNLTGPPASSFSTSDPASYLSYSSVELSGSSFSYSCAQPGTSQTLLRPSLLENIVTSRFHVAHRRNGCSAACDVNNDLCLHNDSENHPYASEAGAEHESLDCSSSEDDGADDTDVCVFYTIPPTLTSTSGPKDVPPSTSQLANTTSYLPQTGSTSFVTQESSICSASHLQQQATLVSRRPTIGDFGHASAFQRIPPVCNIVPRALLYLKPGAKTVTGEKDLLKHSASASLFVAALDAEVALYSKFAEIGERFRKHSVVTRTGADNPVASLLTSGDSKHFVPVW